MVGSLFFNEEKAEETLGGNGASRVKEEILWAPGPVEVLEIVKKSEEETGSIYLPLMVLLELGLSNFFAWVEYMDRTLASLQELPLELLHLCDKPEDEENVRGLIADLREGINQPLL